MEINFVKTHPKSLNLEAIRESQTKVTLGIKCDPELKLLLAELAEESGLTLSSYSEALLFDSLQLKNKVEQLQSDNTLLKDLVNFYENKRLIEIFNKHNGKNIVFYDSNKKKINLKISSIKDAYTVMINSFKF